MPTTLQSYNPGGTNVLTPVQFPENARETAFRIAPGLTLPAGQYMARYSSDTNNAYIGQLAAFSNGATNGLGAAVGLNKYSLTTDASGNVYLGSGQGTAVVATTLLTPLPTAPVYVAGTFDTADLIGGNATANTNMGANTNSVGASTFLKIPG
jgi:hypothetical protein